MKRFFILVFSCTSILFSQHLLSEAAVGGVTYNSAKFRVNLSAQGTVIIRASLSENFSNPVTSVPVITDPAKDNTIIIELTGFAPSSKYYYQVLINGSPSDNNRRSFKTFAFPGSDDNFSFAFGSCQQTTTSNNGMIFGEMVKYAPDFFLQIGDWTYPDTTDRLPADPDFFAIDYQRVLQSYRAKFEINYNMDTLLRSTPVAYVYDDHDYMNNNASSVSVSYQNLDGNEIILQEIPVPFTARQNSIRGFIENMPDYAVENSSRGIYRKFVYGNAEFYMLDLRSQRSPDFSSLVKNASNGKWEFNPGLNHTILGNSSSVGQGEDQFSWLKRNLLASTAKWKFLISSVPFNRGYLKAINMGITLQDSIIHIPNTQSSLRGIELVLEVVDKWAGFIDDLEELINFIQTNNISNVFVLSGDSHTAAMDDGANAGFPEIMSANLDIRNSRSAAAFHWLGVQIWNRAIQGVTTESLLNTFGNIKVYGNDSVAFNIIDESGLNIGRMTMHDQSVIPQIINFTANYSSSREVVLSWSVPSEMNVRNFEIEKSADGIIFRKAAVVNKGGTDYSYTDLYDYKVDYYRIKITGTNGSFRFSKTVKIASIETGKSFTLMQNYPNPFNAVTNIKYILPEDSRVTIMLFDILGKGKKIITDLFQKAGEHETEIDGTSLASGIYLYSITAGNYSAVRKMILLK